MRRTQNKAQFINGPTTHELRRAIRYASALTRHYCKQIISKRNFGRYETHTFNFEEGC